MNLFPNWFCSVFKRQQAISELSGVDHPKKTLDSDSATKSKSQKRSDDPTRTKVHANSKEGNFFGKDKNCPPPMLNKATISPLSIEKEAGLHATMRKSRVFALEHDALVRNSKETINQVYKVGLVDSVPPKDKISPVDKKILAEESALPIAYLKTGDANQQSTAVLERLMWDASNILGFERFFAATGKIALNLKAQPDDATNVSRVPYITTEGEFKFADNVAAPSRGSIQPAIQGVLIEAYLDSKRNDLPPIPKEELNGAVLASVVFGMFDAHTNNIIITPKGEIRFFDNARSLPNSNGLINRGRNCIAPYRCALLELTKDVEKQLTSMEKKELLKKAIECKSKINELGKFFESPLVKSKLKKLPPGWMDTDAILKAMEERVNLIVSNLESPKPISLLELAVRSNPGYQLAFGFSFLNRLITRKDKIDIDGKDGKDIDKVIETLIHDSKSFHSSLSSTSITKCLNELRWQGYDINAIMKLSEDSSNFNEFMVKLISYHIEMLQEKKPQGGHHNYKAMEKLMDGVQLDMKEYDSKTCKKRILQKKHMEAIHSRYPCFKIDRDDPECNSVSDKEFIIQDEIDRALYFAYRTNHGLKLKHIYLSEIPGKVFTTADKIGKPISIKRAAAQFKSKKSISVFNELAPYDSRMNTDDLFKHGNAIEIFQEGKNVVAFLKMKDESIKQLKYRPGGAPDTFTNEDGEVSDFQGVIEHIRAQR